MEMVVMDSNKSILISGLLFCSVVISLNIPKDTTFYRKLSFINILDRKN